MKIALLGTKGIPNNYGGYEQFAEYISTRLVLRGHEVTVYNPANHPYKHEEFKGVKIVRKYCPENLIGPAAHIVYDYLCLKDALDRNFDIVYEAGYHSVALSYKVLRIKRNTATVVVTNMDGLEWKRLKWSKSVQSVIKKFEKIAVSESPYLIADNIGIQEYLRNMYGVNSFYLPYGADIVKDFDKSVIDAYDVEPYKYFVMVARMEPENNIETVIRGHLRSNTSLPLLIVSNHANKYGQHLRKQYESNLIRFVGGIYEKGILDSVRHFSLNYIHGHSVGGTNPSLLEAMACQCLIVSHDNPFNSSILEEAAIYFKDEEGLAILIKEAELNRANNFTSYNEINIGKLETKYSWANIVVDHENLFLKLKRHNQIT